MALEDVDRRVERSAGRAILLLAIPSAIGHLLAEQPLDDACHVWPKYEPTVTTRPLMHGSTSPANSGVPCHGPQDGQPPIPAECRVLILRMARENPRWSYLRIRGVLLKVGHRVAATTIRSVLSPLGFLHRAGGLS